mmetsp:Transcript_9365/g.16947  ORF Transcript_9365/g.16947 Transcript_9365/m.16947 type:complete len:211 (-) Transcript_9365:465-1097(-)
MRGRHACITLAACSWTSFEALYLSMARCASSSAPSAASFLAEWRETFPSCDKYHKAKLTSSQVAPAMASTRMPSGMPLVCKILWPKSCVSRAILPRIDKPCTWIGCTDKQVPPSGSTLCMVDMLASSTSLAAGSLEAWKLGAHTTACISRMAASAKGNHSVAIKCLRCSTVTSVSNLPTSCKQWATMRRAPIRQRSSGKPSSAEIANASR